MSTTPNKLVERYLKHLDVELDDLPRDRRSEIVEEIAGHIAEARGALEHETKADVRNILEGLGDPAEIAAEARERFEVPPQAARAPYKPGWIEVGALVLLLIGGLILPFVGWLVGVVLLWASNAWNVRDKVIGTLFVPGGLGFALLITFFLTASITPGDYSATTTDCEIDPATGREFNCIKQVTSSTGSRGSTGSTDFWDVLTTGFYIALLVVPIITIAYLTYRLRRQPAAATA
jgi:uncharacterized membrane protein